MTFDPVALAQAGPTTILLVGIAWLGLAFVRGWVVPGWIYRDERQQRATAETQAQRNAEALESLAKAIHDRTPRTADPVHDVA
jgi:hypothetical protein